MIKFGDADIFLAGGAEASISAMGLSGFGAMKALSSRNDEPQKASRPFDKDRDGFVMSEGAGIVVIEDLEHAKSRDADIYCEIAGYGVSADAYHMTAPHPEGEGAINVMNNCIKDSGLNYKEVDLINMHGTSTSLGDKAEAKAVKAVFKDHAYNLNINSTKSMTGHLLGAAGAVEAISCVLAINNDIVPPTINHFNEDPEIDNKLNFTFNKAQKRKVSVAMSNTFGFGGHNACVLLKEFIA